MRFDLEKQIIVEADASDFVSTAILSQHKESDTLQQVPYCSKNHSSAEYNHEICDKELLAILREFKE